MATAGPTPQTHDRHIRRKPFAWMRRLANLKGSSSNQSTAIGRKNQRSAYAKQKNSNAYKNNPYPESGRIQTSRAHDTMSDRPSFVSSPRSTNNRGSFTSLEPGEVSHGPPKSLKSTAPTLATNPETIHSDSGRTGHSNNVGGGANSTWSSPNPSERSLTTTLTTIQSTAPSALLGQNQQPAATGAGPSNTTTPSTPAVHFSHQFPTSPASAIPQHLATGAHPLTYNTATANNLLTDNASIVTLASSSKRRRRRSVDTDASVRALAPSSLWGGSRESLPLSVLSNTFTEGGAPSMAATGAGGAHSSHGRQSVGGLTNAERASVYSSSGVTAPVLSSERNSYYASRGATVDGGSVRSGFLGHGRTESISGSIGGAHVAIAPLSAGSPLASPREPSMSQMSRRSLDMRRRSGAADSERTRDEAEEIEHRDTPGTTEAESALRDTTMADVGPVIDSEPKGKGPATTQK